MEEKRKLKKPLWIWKAVRNQDPNITPQLFHSRKYKLEEIDIKLGTIRWSEPDDIFHTVNLN